MQKTYLEKLKDPRWQKKRLEVLSRDDFSCTGCGDNSSTLHVHHISYQGNNPWDTDLDLLRTLCEYCHNEETKDLVKSEKYLSKTLKDKGFISTDFNSLAEFIKNMPVKHAFEVQFSAFEWFLNDENVSIIIDKFFNHLSEKNAKS